MIISKSVRGTVSLWIVFIGLTVALAPFLLVGCSGFREIEANTSNNGWVQIATGDDEIPLEILARKLSGTQLFEYQVKSDIPRSVSDCQAAFRRDIQSLAAGAEVHDYPVYEIVYNTADSLLTYVVHKEPFPFKNTEMAVRYDYYAHEDGQMGVTWKEAWDEYVAAPSGKLSRVETFRGSWDFLPLAIHTTRATHTLQFDPKGMPRWIAEPMVIRFMKQRLKDMMPLQ